MNKNIFKLLLGLMFIYGTASPQEKKGAFLFRTMQDELGRNMKELSLPGMERPFFMEYVITEGKSISLNATLGSIKGITEQPLSRYINVKVLVGDYHRTNAMTYRDMTLFAPITTTIDDNYRQIKRDLWQQTDIAYKKAAKEYSQKMAILKQKKLSQEDLDLDDFSKVEPVDKVFPSNNIVINKSRISRLLEEMSDIFKNYPEIDNSVVFAFYSMNNVYVVNSENSKYSFPNNMLSISVSVSGRADGKTISDNMNICVLQEKDLPSLAKIKAQLNEFAQRFISMKHAQAIKDYYSGPVLIEGPAVASLFEVILMEGVYATHEPVQGKTVVTLEEKMNCKVVSNEYTVKCMPFLKEYSGEKLPGHFEMDIEGVVPEKELTLIENGILKNVIGNRMPSKYNKASSGYSRSDCNTIPFRGILCPGVLDISTSRGVSKDSLKQLLIKTASENGYKYAYIVRKLDFNFGIDYLPTYLYKVDVADGSEELIRDAKFLDYDKGLLKMVMGSSNNKIVVNKSYYGFVPVTYICPDAILLPDMEIALSKDTRKTPPPVVKSPLEENE